MSISEEPGPLQLEAMAYVDGELAPEARAAFEARLAEDGALLREVSELRGLELLARRALPLEPSDHEWARHRKDPLHRLLFAGGFVALGLGAAAALIEMLLEPFGSGSALLLRFATLAFVTGFVALLMAAVRWRRAELPHDPYSKVQR